MKAGNSTLLSAGDMSGDLSSNAVLVEQFDRFAIQAVWTGTPTGDLTVQFSCDTGDTPSNWTTVTGSTQAAGGASGDVVWDLQSGTRWVRVHYARTSGTGSLTIRLSAKGAH